MKKGRPSVSQRQRSRNNKKEGNEHSKVKSKEKSIEDNPYLYQTMSYQNIKTNRQIERQNKKLLELNHKNDKQDLLLNKRKSQRIKKIEQQLNLEMIDQGCNKQQQKVKQNSQTYLSVKIANHISIFETQNYQKLESVAKFLGRFYLSLNLSKEQVQQDLVLLKKSCAPESLNVLRTQSQMLNNIDI